MDKIYSVFAMLGGVAVFMYGLKLLSDNLERLAGNGMRRLLGKVSNNNLAGVGIGFGVTAIIQSSSALTVMVVGFVNVGIMTLTQASAVIIGSNIGTTLTMQLTALIGDGAGSYFNITAIASLVAFIGLVMIYSKRNNSKRIGSILLGFGMIFIGLELMEGSVGVFAAEDGVLASFFLVIKDSPVLLILFGTAFTAIVQSSSASTMILGMFALKGAISFEASLYALMGMNIGTCFTAMISSIGTNTNARRAAWIHMLVNVIPTIVCYVLFFFIKGAVVDFLVGISGPNIYRQIANFHLLFNVFSAMMLIPFINVLGKIAKLIVPGKDKHYEGFRLSFLDERVLKAPPVAVSQAIKEVANMASLAKKNLDEAINAFLNKDLSKFQEVKVREEEINFLNKAITRYLVQISNLDISYKDEKVIGSLFNVVTDIERVGDHADNIIRYAAKMQQENIMFSDAAHEEISKVAVILDKLYENTMLVFNKRQIKYLNEVNKYEDAVDQAKRDMTAAHIDRLNKGECSAESGAIYLSLASNVERAADHFTNIAESVLTYIKPEKSEAAKA